MDDQFQDAPLPNQLQKAVFVTNRRYLGSGGGGVQWCTREYLATIAAAGIVVVQVGYSPPTDLAARFVRKFLPAPFRALHSSSLVADIVAAADVAGTKVVMLNNGDAAVLAPALKNRRPDLRLVYLSHGVEITDVVNNLRIIPGARAARSGTAKWLGRLLRLELEIREALDAVVCISEEDIAFERWLGSTECLYLERQVVHAPLVRRPVIGRIGTVGTLDHGPNVHGLKRLAEAMKGMTNVEIRLVGGPAAHGKALEREYSIFRYLGRLDDEALCAEAATWCAFVNPIFCQARGASTKVATALGWGLPVLTTGIGGRGYRWNSAALPTSERPTELAALCREVAWSPEIKRWAEGAETVAALAPGLPEVAERLRTFLLPLM